MAELEVKEDEKIKLCFIKNTSHNFTAVEKFLKKRGYDVLIETDIKAGLNKVMAEDPQYIFLAWDHKNENIRSLPKIIYQSSTGQIIPFIMSTQRDQIIQLESSGFENKLYPPLSGPAIQRVISKYEKKSSVMNTVHRKRDSSPTDRKNSSERIEVKSFFSEDPLGDEPEIRQTQEPLSREEKQAAATNVRQRFNKFMPNDKDKRDIAYNPDHVKNLTQKQVDSLEANFNETLKNEMFDMMETFSDAGDMQAQSQGARANKFNEIQEGADNSLMSGKSGSANGDVDSYNSIGSNAGLVEKDEINPKTGEVRRHYIDPATGRVVKIMAIDPATGKPRKWRKEDIDPATGKVKTDDPEVDPATGKLRELHSIDPETGQVLNLGLSDSSNQNVFTDPKLYQPELMEAISQFYVLIIQEPEWTGYLTVASENYLDPESAKVILNNWIKKMIRVERVDEEEKMDLSEINDSVLIEMHMPKLDFNDFCSYKSDFFKEIVFQNKKTVLSFFSFTPYYVVNSVHETEDFLELPTKFIKPETTLPFDVNLFLPENKKFILYQRPGSELQPEQLSRFKKRQVKSVYASIDYDIALLKYRAEFNLKGLIDAYLSIVESKA